jgi:endonuclease/exonuclease/phosphatase (EEP) superfamily protein YafD
VEIMPTAAVLTIASALSMLVVAKGFSLRVLPLTAPLGPESRGGTIFLRPFLSLLCAISLGACARPIESSQPISSSFGAAGKTSLSRNVRVVNWNIYKGTRTRFVSEFARLTRQADVVVLQEMSTHGAGSGPQGTVTAARGRSYVMAHAIRYRDGLAGCATGATANPVRSKVLLTGNSEPIVGTPKSSIVTVYRIAASGGELLVANTHGLNLAGKFPFDLEPFRRQLAVVGEEIARHRGPVVWAGDFNTHDREKTDLLFAETARLRLAHVNVAESHYLTRWPGGFVLDHVFVRGLRDVRARAMPGNGSDHTAIELTFRLP